MTTPKMNDPASTNTGRIRNYATIVYPESAPGDWQDILSSLHVPALISPLHDKDTNPDGTAKKAHYHVLILFDEVKSGQQAKQLTEKFGGVGVEPVHSIRAYARYLAHMDDPEKAPYDVNDVVALGGADFNAITHASADDGSTLREMITYIRTNQITSFARFSDICAMNNEKWFSTLVLKRNSYFFMEYIKSLNWELHPMPYIDRYSRGRG